MRMHGHKEKNDRHWGLLDVGGWEEGEDFKKNLLSIFLITWMTK